MDVVIKLPLALAAATLLLAACGDDGTGTASDPGGSPSTEQSTGQSTGQSTDPPTEPPTPSAVPSDGPYPEFGPTDYTYVLAVGCFCPDAGTPIEITVEDDRVTRAVLAADGSGRGGGTKGDPAADYLWHTIDGIIDEANDAQANGAATVEVDWPAGQDHPDRVFIDEDADLADEQVSYLLSDVRVSSA